MDEKGLTVADALVLQMAFVMILLTLQIGQFGVFIRLKGKICLTLFFFFKILSFHHFYFLLRPIFQLRQHQLHPKRLKRHIIL